MEKTLLIATGNAHKAGEIAAIFADCGLSGWQYCSLADFPGYRPPAEDGDTFLANARIKAAAACAMSGLPTLADDSGLSVEVLGNAPGVYSARYAGEQCDDAANRAKLLRALAGVPEAGRGAAFICLACLALPPARAGEEIAFLTAEGRCAGRISQAEEGEFGFGYDSLFYLPEYRATLAQLTPEEKNAVSHRGQAMRKIAALLRAGDR